MAIDIPNTQTTDRQINLLQQNIKNALSPITSNPTTQGTLLTSQSLKTGSNTINTNLNRTLQGWIVVRKRSSADIYDNQDNNSNSKQTLILISSADVSVDLYVF